MAKYIYIVNANPTLKIALQLLGTVGGLDLFNVRVVCPLMGNVYT